MNATTHFGIVFISDKKKSPGRGVFRIYVKHWSNHDYRGVKEKQVYVMPQVSNLKELERQLDELVVDLAVLRVLIKEEHGENN